MNRIITMMTVLTLAACGGRPAEERGAERESPEADSSAVTENGAGGNGTTRAYANTRFRDVTVMKVGEDQYRVGGRAQIFEANFGWVVEDGHQELKKGFEMTDAGAPEWGKFNFTVEVQKQRPNSTLTLVLYELSAKDGSRQHELAIPLK